MKANAMVMQRNGAGVYYTQSCFWDTVSDGYYVYQWPNSKQAKEVQSKSTLQAIVSVFALSLT